MSPLILTTKNFSEDILSDGQKLRPGWDDIRQLQQEIHMIKITPTSSTKYLKCKSLVSVPICNSGEFKHCQKSVLNLEESVLCPCRGLDVLGCPPLQKNCANFPGPELFACLKVSSEGDLHNFE
ncbi:hypothetical protein Fcan01_05721 [Folsomia candida]|uniref:Uncharacterized protein n=1 Tax=Folsomia candida TaxID=158441 RepID=A0A226ET10_FOLCA|nr:hypothetical protein Fcan01_05721 [Folsomia candida]